MKMTLKQNINTNSLVLKHEILLQASSLIMGREGALQTEKELYLMMSFVDRVIEEDLINYCNEDERELSTLLSEEIEPFFLDLIEREEYLYLYKEVKRLLLQRCKEIWDNQHSVVGMIDTFLTTMSTLTEDDKKEVLKDTARIAEAAFDRRTEIMTDKVEDINSKLENFVRNYTEMQKMKKEENGTE